MTLLYRFLKLKHWLSWIREVLLVLPLAWQTKACWNPGSESTYDSLTSPPNRLLAPSIWHQCDRWAPLLWPFSISKDLSLYFCFSPLEQALISSKDVSLGVQHPMASGSLNDDPLAGLCLLNYSSLKSWHVRNCWPLDLTSLPHSRELCHGLYLQDLRLLRASKLVCLCSQMWPKYPLDINTNGHFPALCIPIFYEIFATFSQWADRWKEVPYFQALSYLCSKPSLCSLSLFLYSVMKPIQLHFSFSLSKFSQIDKKGSYTSNAASFIKECQCLFPQQQPVCHQSSYMLPSPFLPSAMRLIHPLRVPARQSSFFCLVSCLLLRSLSLISSLAPSSFYCFSSSCLPASLRLPLWCGLPLFHSFGPPPSNKPLVLALLHMACLLSDISWQGLPKVPTSH